MVRLCMGCVSVPQRAVGARAETVVRYCGSSSEACMCGRAEGGCQELSSLRMRVRSRSGERPTTTSSTTTSKNDDSIIKKPLENIKRYHLRPVILSLDESYPKRTGVCSSNKSRIVAVDASLKFWWSKARESCKRREKERKWERRRNK